MKELSTENKTPELLTLLEVIAIDKEWAKHPVENFGNWQKRIFLNIEASKLHVIIGVCGGLVQDARVFTNEGLAAEYEKWLCEQYDLPYDKEAREKYYDENEVENEIYNYEVPINLPLPPSKVVEP